MYNSYNSGRWPNRGRRPNYREVVVRKTTTHNAQLELDGGFQLNIHLLHRKRDLFKGDAAGFSRKATIVEGVPFDSQRWYQIVITLTRARLPEEMVKNRHKKLVEKGLTPLIKVGKPFRFDPRRDRRSVSEAFKTWLQEQNLPDELFEQVKKIILSWVPKK